MDPGTVQTLGYVIAGVLVFIAEELKIGLARKSVQKRRKSKELADIAHEQIGDVLEATEENGEQLEDLSESVQDLHHTVAYLHREEIQEEPLARQRLRIDKDDDLLKSD